MGKKRHLRLVKGTDGTAPAERKQLLKDRPWSWLALMMASLASPAVHAVESTLRAFEAPASDLSSTDTATLGKEHTS
ncbi:MAG: hypothetical protein VX223_05720 [Myxococcota bacterium]|nr:hypothetical protein [Myxococcota bacterium]